MVTHFTILQFIIFKIIYSISRGRKGKEPCSNKPSGLENILEEVKGFFTEQRRARVSGITGRRHILLIFVMIFSHS